jgi:hypothetical protein
MFLAMSSRYNDRETALLKAAKEKAEDEKRLFFTLFRKDALKLAIQGYSDEEADRLCIPANRVH